jgi:hypothetical protein
MPAVGVARTPGIVGKEGFVEAVVLWDGYRCSAAYATTDSKGTRRLEGSSATRSVFVPTMCRMVSSGRFERSSCNQMDISEKEDGDVMS